MKRRVLLPVAVLAAAVVIAAGLYLFQPWRIFTSSTLIEDLPAAPAPASQAKATAAPSEAASAPPSAAGVPPAATAPPAAPAAPRELATGRLISHEHASSGTVRILELPDGTRILRFEGLDTSDGPDLRVWLTDAPVLEGPAGWYVFDDGAYLDLGSLKANKGDQNYEIPASAVLADYTSVSIWCARFTVSFAAAKLTT
ncbi:DM13 domain-containing protein [Arthrobacter sp. C152]